MRIGGSRLPDDIAQVLATWQKRLATLQENLDALDGDFNLKLIVSQPERFRGRTKEQVGVILQTLDKLAAFRGALIDVVDQAEKISKDLSFWPPERQQQIQEVQHLLSGLTVTVGVKATDIEARGLLDSATTYQLATLDDVVAQMEADFKRVQDLIRGITRAWDAVTAFFKTTDLKLAMVGHAATVIGMADDPALVALQVTARQCKEDFNADPVAVTEAQLDGLRSRIWEQNERFELLTRQVAGLAADLDCAGEEFRVLEERFRSSAPLLSQAAAEFIGFQFAGEPVTQPTLDELRGTLERLGTAARSGQVAGAVAGTQRVRARMAALRESLEKTRSAAIDGRKALYEISRRLAVRRGQLDQLRARGKTADPGLEAELSRVAILLAGRPISVSACESAARAVEDRIRALT
ncbi:MAG TPA: hypothetical protein VFZ25_13570 [Chloroflexota bacterium]|nr:hypothetical protein [Chloroflexota bacterium]